MKRVAMALLALLVWTSSAHAETRRLTLIPKWEHLPRTSNEKIKMSASVGHRDVVLQSTVLYFTRTSDDVDVYVIQTPSLLCAINVLVTSSFSLTCAQPNATEWLQLSRVSDKLELELVFDVADQPTPETQKKRKNVPVPLPKGATGT